MSGFMMGVDPTRVDDTQKFRLGTRGTDHKGQEFVYLEADEAISASDVVIIHSDFGASQLDTTTGAAGTGTGKKLAVAPGSDVASGDFFWGCIYSNDYETGGVDSAAAYVELYATSTGGKIDDVFDGDVAARGIVFNTTLSGVTVEGAMINYPYVVNTIDA